MDHIIDGYESYSRYEEYNLLFYTPNTTIRSLIKMCNNNRVIYGDNDQNMIWAINCPRVIFV